MWLGIYRSQLSALALSEHKIWFWLLLGSLALSAASFLAFSS
ncbi:hypothetical protein SPWS13_3701 [Shewanella putrefaciens]|nr:hypothetical protein SPWS13_3701 [Shewanella putrefaciens]